MKRLLFIFLLYNGLLHAQISNNGIGLYSYAVAGPPPAFTPAALPSLAFWVAADDLGLSNNDPVSTWTDKSTAGNTVTESGTNRPTYKTNIQNGLPAVLFTTDDFMKKASPVGIGGVTGLTISVVIKQSSLAVNESIATFWNYASAGGWAMQTDDASSSNAMIYVANASNDAGGNNVHSTNASLSSSSFAILTMVYDGSQTNSNRVKFYKNGTLLTMTTNGTIATTLQSSSADLRLGMFPGLNRFFNGYIGEMVICGAALNGTQLTDLDTFLNGRWAIH